MFAEALKAYKAHQADLCEESARATAAAKRAAQDLAFQRAAGQNTAADTAFRAQERIGAELRAVRKAAGTADKEVAALARAVQQLERQTLLYGDLENYLSVIEREICDISGILQCLQDTPRQPPAGSQAPGAGGSSPARQ